MTGSTKLKSVPLWTAQYDNSARLDDVQLYGGWDKAFGKQYADKPVDLSVFSV